MKLDGYDVIVGDTVHDVAFGPGKVVSLRDLDDKFEVRFVQGNSGLYRTTGIGPALQRRTLFWTDPVLFVPSKDPARTRLMIQLAVAINTVVRGLNEEIIAQVGE